MTLAVETSGRTGSVAIALGERMLAETAFSAPMRHSAEIFGAVCELLDRFGRKPREIDHIYISVGPGSFTGLRIAVTMAKTMHLTNSTKIVAVDTLDAIAANIGTCEENNLKFSKIAAVLDAKRGQFYIAVYQRSRKMSDKMPGTQYEKVVPNCLMSASQFVEEFANKAEPIWLVGEGLVYYKDRFKANGIEFVDEEYWWPRAQKVHLLGWQMALQGRFADALTLQPAYLRQPEIGKRRKS